jgi:N-acetylglutamate synthase-like GNAT family acetyltransferase
MTKYKKLIDYNIYKSIYDTVYDDDKSEYNWEFVFDSIQRKEFRLYSISENDVTVGVCGFSKISGSVTIYELMVKKDQHKRGYGRKILSYTLSQIKRLPDPPMIVMAFTNAKDFFEKNNFNIIDYDEELVDKYIMMIEI